MIFLSGKSTVTKRPFLKKNLQVWCSSDFQKKDQPAECALRKTKRKTVKKFSCPTQISNRVGGGEKKSPQVHPGHENIYIFIIYIKCLIYSNMYTLHKMSGEGVSHNEALLHQVTSKYSWGKKKKKKVQPKNKPKDKRTKKKFISFQYKHPQADSASDFHEYTLRNLQPADGWSGRKL